MSRVFVLGFGVLLATACGEDKDPLTTVQAANQLPAAVTIDCEGTTVTDADP